MIINYLTSFDRSFKRLDRSGDHGLASDSQSHRPTQEKSVVAISTLLNFFKIRQKPEGLGLKKVYNNYWEIRLDIRYRIIFELSGDEINIAFVGDHNAIKTFLKR